MQVLQSWADNQPQGFADSLQTHLSGTNDPSVFQLCIDPEALVSDPTGEVEVSLGNTAFSFGGQSDLFPHDFSSFQFDAPGNDLLTPLPLALEQTPDFNTLFPLDNGAVEFNADDYLNYDAPPQQIPPSLLRPPVQVEQRAVDPPAPSAARYVPPSGAAFSSTRRVAASWKPPFTIADSPIDHNNPLRSWGVPAT